MRQWINGLLITSMLLGAACSALPTSPKKTTKTTTKTTTKASTKPVTSTTAKPAVPSAKPSPVDLGPTSPFSGKVAFDAHYLISNNAGSLISNAAGSAIVLKGGSIISDNGLGIISDNGLGLISNNGGGIISDNGLGYRLAGVDDVPVGTILPVKGMAVFPISLRSGTLIGKPVFTDETGSYTLAVPDSERGNIRIVARIPVAKKDDPIATDPRVQYNLVVKTSQTAAAPAPEKALIDEDTSVTARYLRSCFAGRIKDIMLASDGDEAAAELTKALGFDESVKTFVSGVVVEINAAAKKVGVPDADDAKVDALAQRLADVMLSYVDLDTAKADPIKWDEEGPKVPALPLMIDTVKAMRVAATQKMSEDPTYFATAPFVTEQHWEREIKKPSDMCDFIVDNFLLRLNGNKVATATAFTFMGVDKPDTQAGKLNGAAIGVLAALGQTMLANQETKKQVIQIIEQAKL